MEPKEQKIEAILRERKKIIFTRLVAKAMAQIKYNKATITTGQIRAIIIADLGMANTQGIAMRTQVYGKNSY